MNKLMATKMIYPIVAILLVIALYLFYKKNAGQEKVSEFGKYKAYSEAIYDGTKRISDYLTLSNGTRNGVIVDGVANAICNYNIKLPGESISVRKSYCQFAETNAQITGSGETK